MPKIEDNNHTQITDQKHDYSHFVGVKFLNTPRAYFFGTTDNNYALGDKVVQLINEM